MGASARGRQTTLFSGDRLDAVSVLAGLLAIITLGGLAVGTIQSNPIIAQKAALGLLFLITGFIPAIVNAEHYRAWTPNLFANIRFTGLVIFFGMLSLGVIFLIEIGVSQAFGSLSLASVLSSKGFYASMGVAEEYLFAYLILNLFTLLTRPAGIILGPLISNFVDSLVFMAYHFTVYGSLGQYVPIVSGLSVYLNSALIAVFLSRFALNAIYQSTPAWLGARYIAVTIIAHGTLNIVLS